MTLPFQLLQPCTASGCLFDKQITSGAATFEIGVLITALVCYYYVQTLVDRPVIRWGLVIWGVFIFEFFTDPMWLNQHMGSWAYTFHDVSWLLTLGWSCIIIAVVSTVDAISKSWSPIIRFAAYLLGTTLFGILGETLVVNLGIRTYSPESMAVIGHNIIPGLNIPWAALYYIPVFMSLIIAFYKFAAASLDNIPVVPRRRRPWLRTLLITYIGVILYEIMIEPMVVNAHFPSWSYFYRDVSIVLSSLWVLIIWLSSTVVERFLMYLDLNKRFIVTLVLSTIFFLPLEAWFIQHGYRQYGPSATANFSGYRFPWTSVPIEVAIAVPFYLSLVLSFVRYWEIQFDSRIVKRA